MSIVTGPSRRRRLRADPYFFTIAVLVGCAVFISAASCGASELLFN